jgi:hypothetical protein
LYLCSYNLDGSVIVTTLKWKLVSVHLDVVATLMQDRRMVCGQSIIGSKIILDAPDGNPR